MVLHISGLWHHGVLSVLIKPGTQLATLAESQFQQLLKLAYEVGTFSGDCLSPAPILR